MRLRVLLHRRDPPCGNRRQRVVTLSHQVPREPGRRRQGDRRDHSSIRLVDMAGGG